MYCYDKLYAKMTTTVPIHTLPGGQGHEHRIECNVAKPRESLSSEAKAYSTTTTQSGRLQALETVRENALVREDANDCQQHSHLYADDVVEIIDVRISETSVSGLLSAGGWIPMGVLTQTSQRDDANIPYFLQYNETHIADTIGVDLGQTRLEFLPYCQITHGQTRQRSDASPTK